jgi:hypothetical protein
MAAGEEIYDHIEGILSFPPPPSSEPAIVDQALREDTERLFWDPSNFQRVLTLTNVVSFESQNDKRVCLQFPRYWYHLLILRAVVLFVDREVYIEDTEGRQI